MEVGARDVRGLPVLAQPAPRQSYAPMASKPAPSSHEPSSETQGQSLGSGEKAGRKFSSTGKRAPGYLLSRNCFQKFKQMLVPPRQSNQTPVTLIYQWKNKGGRGGEKRMIQRLNEESGHQENVVMSTWKSCKQGWLRLS